MKYTLHSTWNLNSEFSCVFLNWRLKSLMKGSTLISSFMSLRLPDVGYVSACYKLLLEAG